MNINLEKAILVKMFFFKDKDGTSWDIENNPQSKNGLLKNVILQFQRKIFFLISLPGTLQGVEVA